MRRSWWSWGILSALGLVAILLPDTDRLFSLSEGHGPSLNHGIGVLLLVAGWVVLAIATWRRRHRLSLRREIHVLLADMGNRRAALVLCQFWATTVPGGSSVLSCFSSGWVWVVTPRFSTSCGINAGSESEPANQARGRVSVYDDPADLLLQLDKIGLR